MIRNLVKKWFKLIEAPQEHEIILSVGDGGMVRFEFTEITITMPNWIKHEVGKFEGTIALPNYNIPSLVKEQRERLKAFAPKENEQ